MPRELQIHRTQQQPQAAQTRRKSKTNSEVEQALSRHNVNMMYIRRHPKFISSWWDMLAGRILRIVPNPEA